MRTMWPVIVSAASKGADVSILGTVFNRIVFQLHASDKIKDVKDLKGKTIGTGTPGGNTFFASIILLEHMGWIKDKDLKLLSLGNSPAILAALKQGKVPAGLLTPPTSFIAAELGFRQIFDIGALDVPFPTISIVSPKKFIRENPDVIMKVLKATSEAVYIYKHRNDLAFPVIAKYMKLSPNDPGIAKSHALYGRAMNEKLVAWRVMASHE